MARLAQRGSLSADISGWTSATAKWRGNSVRIPEILPEMNPSGFSFREEIEKSPPPPSLTDVKSDVL